MKRSALVSIGLVLALLALDGTRAASRDKSIDPSRFNPTDVFQLEYASDPQLSPDGRHIVYVRNHMDIMSDRRRSALWIIGADGSNHRPLTTGRESVGSPRWSPDGGRLAYVSGGEGPNQLYLRWMDTGQSARLAQLTHSPDGLAWSPDGEWIAFSMLVREKDEPFVEPVEKPEGAEWAPPPRTIRKLTYRFDGQGYLEEGYTHLFVVPADGGTPRQLTTGHFNHQGPPAWLSDGSALVFSANRHDDWEYDPRNSEIYTVSVTDRRITALTDRQGPDTTPVVSSDGKRIAYLGFDDRYQGYQVTRLYVMNRDGTGRRVLTEKLDRSVQAPAWDPDGGAVYVSYSDRGNTRIARVTLDGGIDTVAGNVGGTSIGRPYASGSFSVAARGVVAFTETRPDRPADVAAVRRGSGSRRLTRLNDDLFGHKKLAGVEEIVFESSFDGRSIQGWIAKPPDFEPGKKYPMILEIHGGPFADYGDRFSAEVQLFAAAGYVVLYLNPRGSTSYGEEFGNLIHHAYPGQDFDDLMSGVDAVIGRGYVDPSNLFVTGGSGGGVLTAWIVGKTDRFRAAVVAKPVINWYSFVLTADAYNFFYKYWFPGFPWDHPEHYLKRSPLSLVGNVTTPTMLLTGEADYRTPISESEQYYQALKLRKIDTALVRVPEASHGIAARPSHLMAKVAHVLRWFEIHR